MKCFSSIRTRIRSFPTALLLVCLLPALHSTFAVAGAANISIPVGAFVPALKEGSNTDPVAVLPDGFAIGGGPLGLSLVWSNATGNPIFVGGSRYEFRLSGESSRPGVFGYPRELGGQLHLSITVPEQAILVTDGLYLELWKSGKRLDGAAPSKLADRVSTASYNSPPPVTPTVPVDPAARGPYTTRRLSYNLKRLNVSEYPAALEVLAEVTHPNGASGSRPLVLFLHGRHTTCYTGGANGSSDIGWPCPEGWLPIPSHRGYRYVADLLASQGYIVVSISANGINGQDYASNDAGTASRSILIRHHLALWAKWNSDGGDPWRSRFRGKVRMDQVVLVGHSRGGEGVNRAAIDASESDPYKIVGLVTYGPTAFGRQVTPDIHSATILPTCDGDVSDLQGQAYVDASRDLAFSEALRSAVTTLGANHNYFNTEWTPGLSVAPSWDDWYENDSVCGAENGALRLTPLEQQVVGAAYTAALVRLSVGNEASMLPLLDGSFVKPESIGRAEVSVSAVGGAGNRLLYRPGDDSLVQFGSGMKGSECYGSFSRNDALPLCDENSYGSSPHWLPSYFVPGAPSSLALRLTWSRQGDAFVRFDLERSKRNLSVHDWVDVRVANDPNKSPVSFQIIVQDDLGRNATLVSNLTTIDGWPGTGGLDRIQAKTLRGSLQSVRSRVNLSRIASVLVVARVRTGRVWVLDVAASQAKVVQPVVLNLPVISVDSLATAAEGGGLSRASLNITANPPPKFPGTIWVSQGYGDGYELEIPAGSNSVVAQVPLTWYGDDLYGTGSSGLSIALLALKGVVTGNYSGGLTVVEDDPIPVLSAVATNVTSVEGQFLRWTLKLSAPTAGTQFSINFVPPGGTELKSNDVDPNWLRSRTYDVPPRVPVPLSSMFIYTSVSFDYGEQTADFVVPVVQDAQGEGGESVRLAVSSFDGSEPLFLVGTVRRHG